MSRTVKLEFELTDELIEDISVTAAEGAINYWADVEYGFITRLHEGGEDLLTGPISLSDPGLIKEGIEMALAGEYCNERIRGYVLNAVTHDDASYIDADAADVIVQLGLFAGLVFA